MMGKVRNFFRAQKITLALQQEQQMLALDQEFVSLESQVKTLQAEKLHLEGEVNPLKRENERLKEQIEKSATHGGGLDEVEVKVLQTLSVAGRIVAAAVAAHLGISQTKAEYHLTKLEDANFIHGSHFYTGQATEYSLIQRGREYLVEHGLV